MSWPSKSHGRSFELLRKRICSEEIKNGGKTTQPQAGRRREPKSRRPEQKRFFLSIGFFQGVAWVHERQRVHSRLLQSQLASQASSSQRLPMAQRNPKCLDVRASNSLIKLRFSSQFQFGVVLVFNFADFDFDFQAFDRICSVLGIVYGESYGSASSGGSVRVLFQVQYLKLSSTVHI